LEDEMTIKLAKPIEPVGTLELLSVFENYCTKTVIIAFSPPNEDGSPHPSSPFMQTVDLKDDLMPLPVKEKKLPHEGDLTDEQKAANDKVQAENDQAQKTFKTATETAKANQWWTDWQNDTRTSTVKASDFFLKKSGLKSK
jgi:hypothetical protein